MVADLTRIKPLRRLLQASLMLLVIIAGFAVYAGVKLTQLTADLNQHTESIRILNRLLSALQNIETGQRGYVITGYDDFLQPFEYGNDELVLVLEKLPKALPGDRQNVDRLLQLAEARLENADAVVRARRSAGFEAAQAMVMSRRGKQLMDDLRDTTDPLLNRLRVQIETGTWQQNSTELMLLISITAFVLMLMLLVPASLYVWRQQQQKDSLESQRLKLTRELLTAQVDERKRISQLLHDDVAQVVAAAKLSLEAEQARTTSGYASMPERLSNVIGMLDRALLETRSLLGEMRPPLLTELGLQAALSYEVDRMRDRAGNTTLAVLWQEQGDACRFDGGTEHSVFLLVREALHNAIRHAKASHIRVDGDCTRTRLRLTVQDDGAGFEVEDIRKQEGHLGVIGMRERAASLGAELDISSRPGRGTVITLTLPR